MINNGRNFYTEIVLYFLLYNSKCKSRYFIIDVIKTSNRLFSFATEKIDEKIFIKTNIEFH